MLRVFLAALLAVTLMSAPASALPDELYGWERVAVQTATEEPETEQRTTYRVKRGDTLSKIDRKTKSPGPWTRLAFVNRKEFDNPDIIEVGIKLVIPAKDGRRLKFPPRPDPVVSRSSTPYRDGGTGNPSPSAEVSGGIWYALMQCEAGSSGGWSANTGNGYYGGLQFTLSSWRAAGGSGYPHQASAAEQIKRGQILQRMQGWGAWPHCSQKLGLR